MLDGWISSGEYGSTRTRPDSISPRMSRSESSTLATYRFRYDVVAKATRPEPAARSCGCSSMAERQLPKLIVRVRFSSPALIVKAQARTGIPNLALIVPGLLLLLLL